LIKYSVNIEIDQHLKDKPFFYTGFVFDRDFNQSISSISKIYGLKVINSENQIRITDKNPSAKVTFENFYPEVKELCPNPIKDSINYFVDTSLQKKGRITNPTKLLAETRRSINEETQKLHLEILPIINKLVASKMQLQKDKTIRFNTLDNYSKC
jgi:hypothetical protein